MIKKYMVDNMKAGSVTVDLAAVAGGNVETTVADKAIVTDNGVTCIGYTDLPSRMAATASNLFGGNVTKFLLSMHDKENDQWVVDLEGDEAVRSICCVHKGTPLDEYVPPPPEPKDESTA